MIIKDSFIVSYASPTPVDTQFVFIGVLKLGVGFQFSLDIRARYSLRLSTNNNLNSRYEESRKPVWGEDEKLSSDFIGKPVILMVKFTRVGVACNIINIEQINSHSFTFKANNFTFKEIWFQSPIFIRSGGRETFPIQFFGLTEGDKLSLQNRFLMEEIYRK